MLLSQRRTALVLLLLSFSSGLPLALTSTTLQTWVTVEHIDLQTIGFLSLIGQAYVFKFLWSPFMDRYPIPWPSGRRRGWLLATQLLLIALLCSMAMLQPTHHLFLLCLIAVMVAVCSASQDIVFDAWKADNLDANQRGKGAAFSILGYRIAMLISGGLALWLASHYLGFQGTYGLMALLMLTGIIGTALAQESPVIEPAPFSLHQAIVAPLQAFFQRDNAWLMISLIICYKLGDAFASALMSPFLLIQLKFQVDDLALINKTLGLLATILGTLTGGLLMQKVSLYRALLWFGLLQAGSNLAYWILAITPPHLWRLACAIFIENLCAGMGTAAFVALLMTLCQKRYSATQFALLSALSAVARVYIGPLAGFVAINRGWPEYFALSVLLGLPGLILLYFARRGLDLIEQHGIFNNRNGWPQGYKRIWQLFLLAMIILLLALLLKLIQPVIHWPLTQVTHGLILSAVIVAGSVILIGVTMDCLQIKKKLATKNNK